MLYFPIIWVLSILSYVLFFIKLRKNEFDYNVDIERHPGNKFPKIKEIKSIIRNTKDKNIRKDFRLLFWSFLKNFNPGIKITEIGHDVGQSCF